VLVHYVDRAKKDAVRRVCNASYPELKMARRYTKVPRKRLLATDYFSGALQGLRTNVWHGEV
jgi:hypothetical protein